MLGLLAPGRQAAQPIPCGAPAAMTSTCATACVVCDINGFTGRNNSSIQGQAPPGFCTTVVHHMQWIAFIAGSTNLTLRVDVFGCQLGQGLEIGLYQTSNCQTFSLVSNCNTNAANNNAAVFTNTVPLVIGQHYYFVMDGSANDICNYNITVVSGSTQVPPLTSSGSIDGPALVCPSTPASFSTPGQTGASLYNWTLNGAPAGSGQTLNVTFPSTPGAYQLCLTAANACSTAPQSCSTIMVPAIPTTNLSRAICPGECATVADTLLCVPGMYERRFLAASGCDSLVRIEISEAPDVVTHLDLFICAGDTLFVAGNPYFQSGQFQEVLLASNGCDSVVNLALTIVICEIEAQINARPVSCRGDTDGTLIFGVTNGTAPFTYVWRRIGPSFPAGQGALASTSGLDTLTGLPPGQYLITINDLFGNDVILLAEVNEPSALSAMATASDYNSFGISCYDGTDGVLQAMPSGGTAPYFFLWNTGATSSEIRELPTGSYTLTLTDAAGCTLSRTFELTQPEALSVEALFTDPGCEGPETGAISVEMTSGGVRPYAYALGVGSFGSDTVFAGLQEGSFELLAQDANGCIASASGTLVAAAIPVIELGDNLTLELGKSVRLNAVVNTPMLNPAWTPSSGLSCTDCLQPEVRPLRTTTFSFGGSSVDGCFAEDSVTIVVLTIRDVFVPNAFSPNDDGINDRFTIYGGPEVLQIRRFRVFSRWGDLVFDRKEFPANEETFGWNGTFKEKALDSGAFTWFAEVEFIDGLIALYEGGVTIVR